MNNKVTALANRLFRVSVIASGWRGKRDDLNIENEQAFEGMARYILANYTPKKKGKK